MSSLSYKKATRCHTCQVLYLSKSEARVCEAMHERKQSSKIEDSSDSENEYVHPQVEVSVETSEVDDPTFMPDSEAVSSRKMQKPTIRDTLWDSESCEKLIKLVRDNYETIVAGKSYEKKFLWLDIAKDMQDMVPGLTDLQIKTKWYNMRLNYIKYVEHNGKGHMRPEHMELLETFVKDTSLVSAPVREYPKKASRGGPREALWDAHSREKLIEFVKEDYDTLLNGKSYEKELVWDKIYEKMREILPGLNDAQIKGKWNNIRFNLVKYMEIEDKGRMKKPEHMDLLMSFLKQDKTIRSLTYANVNSDSEGDEDNDKQDCSNGDIDNVYSLLCHEISKPKIRIRDFHSEYSPSKKQKVRSGTLGNPSPNIDILLKDIAKQLRTLNDRDKEFKQYMKKTLKKIEQREHAREDREVAREEREMAREEREQEKEKMESEIENKQTEER